MESGRTVFGLLKQIFWNRLVQFARLLLGKRLSGTRRSSLSNRTPMPYGRGTTRWKDYHPVAPPMPQKKVKFRERQP